MLQKGKSVKSGFLKRQTIGKGARARSGGASMDFLDSRTFFKSAPADDTRAGRKADMSKSAAAPECPFPDGV